MGDLVGKSAARAEPVKAANAAKVTTSFFILKFPRKAHLKLCWHHTWIRTKGCHSKATAAEKALGGGSGGNSPGSCREICWVPPLSYYRNIEKGTDWNLKMGSDLSEGKERAYFGYRVGKCSIGTTTLEF